MKIKYILKRIESEGDCYLSSSGNKFILREEFESGFNSLSIELFDSEDDAIKFIQRLPYSKAIYSIEKILTR